MFINVTIAPETVNEVSTHRQGAVSALLRKSLFALINKYGSITQPSTESANALVSALKSDGLSPSEQKEWQEFLVSLRNKKRFSVAEPEVLDLWNRLSDPLSYESMRSMSSMLNIVTEDAFKSEFTDESYLHSVTPHIEVATPTMVEFSKSAQRLDSLIEEGTFTAGTSREEIWAKLLGPLAASSEHITLFDPYLYYRLWQESSRSRPEGEHLEWLLGKIDQLPTRTRHVTLVGAAGDGSHKSPSKDPHTVLNFLDSHFSGFFDSAVKVKAFVVPRRGNMHHDRHLRFSSGQAIGLPAGIDRFATPKLQDSMSFTYRDKPKPFHDFARRETNAIARASGRTLNG